MKLLSGAWVQTNIYFALLLHLLLTFIFSVVLRLAFFAFNASLYSGIEFSHFLYLVYGGLQFDLVAVIYLNFFYLVFVMLPFEFRFKKWYKPILHTVYLVPNIAGLAANYTDFIYFRFTGRRSTVEVFSEFANETNYFKFFTEFLFDYWYIAIFWIITTVLFVYMYFKIRFKPDNFRTQWHKYVLWTALIFPVFVLSIGAMRGGFKHSTRPIAPGNAGTYINQPNEAAIVLNTPFSIIRTLSKKVLEPVHYFKTEAELNQYFTPISQFNSSENFHKKNVVIIILESFGQEYIGYFNSKLVAEYGSFTPFLDSLFAVSYTPKNAFANGRKSIDVLPSVMASIPMVGSPFAVSNYYNNKFNGLGSILGSEGYHTSFFHGAPNGSMGFDAFVKTAGFAHYFGMNEYGNKSDFGGLWGIWDEEFLQFWAQKLNEFPQPFLSAVFTLSSHHPFVVPEKYKGKFKDGPLPVFKTVAYTDMALRKFFETAAKQPWYKNTLFVITADHASTPHYNEYTNIAGTYKVPVVFFAPDSSLKNLKPVDLVQQTDILPSVLHHLHYKKPFAAFGNSVFDNRANRFAFNFDSGVYQYYSGDYLLQFSLQSDYRLYNYKTDLRLQNNLANQLPDTVNKIAPFAKALVQQYHNRMIENRLTK